MADDVIWYVYIVECSDERKSLYTGITNDIDRRIQQHNEGTGAKFTKGRGPVTLVKSFTCNSKSEALKLEYHIKQLSREEKLSYEKE
jgi:putative endonuclease